MNFFELLVLTHFIADWIFQTQKQAEMKSKQPNPYLNRYLIDHSLIYMAFFVPVLVWKLWPIGSGSALLFTEILFLLFFSHAFLDCRKFELWVLKKVKGIDIWTDGFKVCPYFLADGNKKDLDMGLFWILLITIDQIFHIIVLAFIAMVM